MSKRNKHIKRIAMPNTWPIARKGNKYIMKPRAGRSIELCLPICIVLRDLLKIAQTKREVQRSLIVKEISINGKTIDDFKFPVGLFDVISIPKINKHYRIEISKYGKLEVNETKDFNEKPCKVVGKSVLSEGRIQINLSDGRNFIEKDSKKIKVNDSVIVDLKQNKIMKHLPLSKDSFAWVIKGKHAGEKGTIKGVENKEVTIESDGKEIRTTIKNIFITK